MQDDTQQQVQDPADDMTIDELFDMADQSQIAGEEDARHTEEFIQMLKNEEGSASSPTPTQNTVQQSGVSESPQDMTLEKLAQPANTLTPTPVERNAQQGVDLPVAPQMPVDTAQQTMTSPADGRTAQDGVQLPPMPQIPDVMSAAPMPSTETPAAAPSEEPTNTPVPSQTA